MPELTEQQLKQIMPGCTVGLKERTAFWEKAKGALDGIGELS